MATETKYGTVTEAHSDFGYGYVTEEDGCIAYRDSTRWKTWKTVKGFERWADRQNEKSGGVFSRIEARGH